MASLHSKWEARISIPAGDWTATLLESGGGGSQVITLTAASTYYWSSPGNDTVDLPAKLKALLDAASVAAGNSNTYTVTVSASESGTGLLTISVSAGTFTLTSIDNDLQALMGLLFEMTPTAASFVGGLHVEGLWLPDCPVETPYGLASAGLPVSATQVTLAEDGTYYRWHGSMHRRTEHVYHAVSLKKSVAASESTAGESYESFWLDAMRGEEPWASAGRNLRFHKDASDDATYLTRNDMGGGSPEMQRLDAAYEGYWTIRIDTAES